MAFLDWVWLDYRPTRHSKTIAEKMLEEDISEGQRIVLKAIIAAAPSIYCVKDIREGTLILHDILLNTGLTAFCPEMAKNTQPGEYLPARIHTVGNRDMVKPAGPILQENEVQSAVSYLVANGLKLTPDGLRKGSHLFGRLWKWQDERE
jgi:hypothetical protein